MNFSAKLLVNKKAFLVVLAFLLLINAIISAANPPQNLQKAIYESDSSLTRSVEYLKEDPHQALLFAHESIKSARLKDDSKTIAIGYFLLSSAYFNIGDLDRSIFYIDAAEKILADLKSLDLEIEIAELKLKILTFQGKSHEATETIEILIKHAKSSNNVSKHVNALLVKGNYYRQVGDYGKSLDAKLQAVSLSEKSGEWHLIAQTYHSLGSTFFLQSNFIEANDWYHKALTIKKQIGDSLGITDVLINISLAHRDLGNFDDSRSSLTEALSLANLLGNMPLMADCYNLFGSLEFRIGNLAQAINYYDLSLRKREQLGYLSSMASNLENLSRVYLQLNQYDDAENSLTKAITIRKQLNDYKNLAAAQNDLGNVYSQKGELAEALKYYLTSLKIRQEWGEPTEIARSLTNIGITYRKIGSHKNALKYFDEALELNPSNSDPIGKAYIYIHQGNTHRDMSNPQQALKSYVNALELRKVSGNQLLIAQSLRSIASAYSDLGDFSNAKDYVDKALVIYINTDDQRGIADASNEMGNILLLEEDFENALFYFEKASGIYGKQFDIERRGLCLRKIGEIQLKLGRFSQSAENLNLALKLAVGTKNGKLVETTLLSLYEYYYARGEFHEAINYYKKHIAQRDTLLKIQHKEEIWQASLDLELDKKATEIKMIEHEVDKLRQDAKVKVLEIERQKLISNFFALAFLFFLVIASLSIYGYSVIRRRNRQLKEINEKLALSEQNLQSLINTKDKLFSIIAHDLKSPFTALVGLTEVLKSKSESIDNQEFGEYAGYVHESSHKLLTLIENLLDWSRSQTGKINLQQKRIKVSEIFLQTQSILNLQASTKGISLEVVAIDNLEFFADFDTTFTVLRNLVSNAIKFTDTNGYVWLGAHKNDAEVILFVKDSGVGIGRENLAKLFKPESNVSTLGTKNESGTGLGLIVCKEFIEMNNGKIWVESEIGQGTTFYVSLPQYNANKK